MIALREALSWPGGYRPAPHQAAPSVKFVINPYTTINSFACAMARVRLCTPSLR